MTPFRFYRDGDAAMRGLRDYLLSLSDEQATCHPRRAKRQLHDFITTATAVLPEETAAALSPDLSLEELRQFFDERVQDYECRMAERNRTRRALPFSEAVQTALDHLDAALEDTVTPPIPRFADGCITIISGFSTAYRESLILEGAQPLIWRDEDWEGCYYYEIERSDGGYWMTLRVTGWDDEPIPPLYLSFTDIRAETVLYDYLPKAGAPWDRLAEMLNALSDKQRLGLSLNEGEQRFLPLAQEAVPPLSGDSTEDFTLTAEQYAAVQPYAAEDAALAALLKPYSGNGQKWRHYLRSPASEPFWRHILADAASACAAYNPPETLLSDAQHTAITAYMRQQGFGGSYPLFTAVKPLTGVRLVVSTAGQSNIIGGKETIQSIIRFEENAYDMLHITVTTTVTKRRQPLPADEIAACFVGENRLYRRDLWLAAKEEYPQSDDEWAELCRLTAKTGLLEKLTREEKRSRFYVSKPALGCGWIFAGLLFGLLLTAGMMLFTSILTLCVTQSWSEMLTIFRDAPWGWMIADTSVAFGGSMWLIEHFSR